MRHADRGRVDHQLGALQRRSYRLCLERAGGQAGGVEAGGQGGDQTFRPTHGAVGDGHVPRAGLQEGHRDRSRRPTRAQDQRRYPLRVTRGVGEAAEEAGGVGVVSDQPVALFPDRIHGTDQPGFRAELVNGRGDGLLVRHGDVDSQPLRPAQLGQKLG